MNVTIEDAKKWLIENKIEGELNAEQIWVIGRGLEDGLDVSVYADPKFSEEQMEGIKSVLRVGIDILIDEGEIRLGLEGKTKPKKEKER